MKKRIRIQGTLIFFAIITAFLVSKIIFPHWTKSPFDEVLDAVGILLVLCGYLFRIAARGYKEENTDGGNRLVKDGPYSLIRNPMYFGTMLIGCGIICVLFVFWAAPLFLIIYLSIYIPQIKKEEGVLLGRFGKEYQKYCSRVPQYFPNLGALLRLKENLSLRLSWVKKELPSLLITFVFILGIEAWEDVKLFGLRKYSREFLTLALIIVSFVSMVIATRKKNKRDNS